MNQETKIFRCFSGNLAKYLIAQGFQLLWTDPNLKDPRYNVFIFHDTEDLRAAVRTYSQHK